MVATNRLQSPLRRAFLLSGALFLFEPAEQFIELCFDAARRSSDSVGFFMPAGPGGPFPLLGLSRLCLFYFCGRFALHWHTVLVLRPIKHQYAAKHDLNPFRVFVGLS